MLVSPMLSVPPRCLSIVASMIISTDVSNSIKTVAVLLEV